MKHIYFALLVSLICFQRLNSADKYIHTNTNWSTAVWFGSSSGNDTATAPSDTDNVFTNGFQLTVDGNYACDSLTLTSLSSALIVNSPNSLTIHGKLIGPGNTGNDIIGGSGTVIFKRTTGSIIQGIYNRPDFENVTIDPGAGNTVTVEDNVYIQTTGTGKITIASGTLVLDKSANDVIRSTTDVQGTLEIAAGATLHLNGGANIRSSSGTARIGTVTINGTLLVTNGYVNAASLNVGTTGYLKVLNGTFWSALPTTFTSNGITEYARIGNTQNVCPGAYKKIIVSGTYSKVLTGTTSVDSIHFVAPGIWGSSDININGKTLNIPSTGSGITPLTGTCIVDITQAGDFYSYHDAIKNLKLRNAGSGGVVINFRDNQEFHYPAFYNDAQPLIIGHYANPVTLGRTGNIGDPNPPTLIIDSTTVAQGGNAIFKVVGAKNVTIDGLKFSIKAGGTLNIVSGIYLESDTNVTVQNCIVDMANTGYNLPANYWRTGGVYVFGDATHVSTNVKLYSNTITNSFNGVYLSYNGGDATLSTGIEIGAFGKGNKITNVQYIGINVNARYTNLKIIGNEIYNTNTNGNSAEVFGIKAEYLSGNDNIVAYNKVYGMANTAANATITGIYLSNPYLSTTDNKVFCYNNMIYDLKATNTNSKEAGIGVYYPGDVYIYNNTVYLNYSEAQTGNSGRGIWTRHLCSNGAFQIKNNLVVCNITPSSNATNYAIDLYDKACVATDYNILYAGDSTVSTNIIGRINGTNYQKFTANYKPYMNGLGKELHSYSEANTPFANISAGSINLNIMMGEPSFAFNHGIPVTTPFAITDDIDGNPRSETPSIGADEGTRYNKYLHANANWNAADVWYDAPTGGNILPMPNGSDEVYTNGYQLTVNGNYACNNLFLSNVANSFSVNSPNQLTINGTLTGPDGWTSTDLIGGNGTVIFKSTSGKIVTKLYGNAPSFENVIIDPGAGHTVYIDKEAGDIGTYIVANTKITIASGTMEARDLRTVFKSTTDGGGTLEISAGATLILNGSSSIASTVANGKMGSLVVKGNLTINAGTVSAANINIESTGYFKNMAGTFWSVLPSTFISDGITEYAKEGNSQNVCPGTYKKLIISGTYPKNLAGTTSVDSIHFIAPGIWGSSDLITNGHVLNIPSTASGNTPLTGTCIVDITHAGDFYTYHDALKNLKLRNAGSGGVIIKFRDNQEFHYPSFYNDPQPLVIGHYANSVTLGRTGNTGDPNPPSLIIDSTTVAQGGNAIFKIVNAKNVTIDGLKFSIKVGGTLNIVSGIYLESDTNVTVQNCIVDMANTGYNLPANYWRTGGIWIDGVTSAGVQHVSNSIKLYSNTITNSVTGIYLAYNGADAISSSGIEIGAFGKGNKITNVEYTGININALFTNLKIIGNEIYNTNTNGNSAEVFGIKAEYLSGDNNIVAYNKVHGMANTAANATITGIYLSNPYLSTADNKVFCYNNMIYDLKATNTNSKEAGIGVYYPGDVHIYNNTVFLNYNEAQTGNSGRGIWTRHLCSNGAFQIKNNLVVCNITPSSNATNYAIDLYDKACVATDYNLLYAGDSTITTNIIGRINGTNYQKFATNYKPFMVGLGKELHSVTEVNTPFVNTTAGSIDIHLMQNQLSGAVFAGTPITTPLAVTDDFDGYSRNLNNPTIGADEFAVNTTEDVYIQDTTFTGKEYITGRKILAGKHVTNTKSTGPVVIQNGAEVTLKAEKSVSIGNGFRIKKNATFRIKK